MTHMWKESDFRDCTGSEFAFFESEDGQVFVWGHHDPMQVALAVNDHYGLDEPLDGIDIFFEWAVDIPEANPDEPKFTYTRKGVGPTTPGAFPIMVAEL